VNKKRVKRAFTDGETIRDLLRAVEQWQLKKEKPGEGIMAAAKELARQWKKKKQSLFAGYDSNLIQLLAALVVALRPYYEVLEPVRRRYPELFKQVRRASAGASVRDWALYLKGAPPEKLPQEAKELRDILWPQPRPLTREQKRKRKHEFGRHLPYGAGAIERQFGSAEEAELQDPGVEFWLDEVFLEKPVTMIRLQQLFGIARKQLVAVHLRAFKHRLPCAEDGSYDWHAVLEILEALLRPQRRRRRGRPRVSWLSEPKKRTRVLRAIEVRLKSISVPKQIKALFLDVIHRYLPSKSVGAK
jgi:hypothetical protein